MQRPTSKSRARAFAPDPDAPSQTCDHPGCEEAAGYRAPRARSALRSYYWFCLDHVRQYNARWDYYKGMTPGQIEAQMRADTSWQRPSWKLGNMGGHVSLDDLTDPLEILRQHGRRTAETRAAKLAPAHLRDALARLDLSWPATFEEVKARYRLLARKHHPDTNAGNAKAAERFKAIGAAYRTLRDHFTTNGPT
ncbi:molecular chaperone DnaJ [Oecophyllibacter saccharovorans]|uniref:J domain-containing protein n=1 Tax=Oecophyllibacter saccharovorans TaxID=2558360 RepID=UPI0011430E18|nr:J domain-containing protein [Oecophyllibacter saccharovorans]QDH14608.1 molecular chaperone DnaJ [Oecophyllibacter saccharovorans]